LPKLSQPFTKAKARSATLGGRVEKLRAFFTRTMPIPFLS
jgi:hypothetical protein